MIDEKIGKLIQDGNKIEAIKLLKDQHGMSLKEAKGYVDSYADEELPDTEKPVKSAAKWEGSFGRLGALLVLFLIIAAVIFYFIGVDL